MLPSIHFLGIHIPSYGLMLTIGTCVFFAFLIFKFRILRKEDNVTFNRLLFVSLVSFIALGEFAFFFNSLFHSIEEKKITIGGITWLGGIIGAIATFLLLTHFLVPKKRGYEFETLSNLMPAIALAHSFGRIGCFLGGCCYGKVSSSPLAVVYPVNSSAFKQYPNADNTGSLPVLPIPLFEAGFEFLLFILLILLPRKAKEYSLAIYSVCYGIFRFCAEFFRGDSRGSVGGAVSPSQLLSILLVFFGIFLFLEKKGILFKKTHQKRLEMQANADELPITRLLTQKDTELLRDLHTLLNEGAITQEEYETKKAEILKRM